VVVLAGSGQMEIIMQGVVEVLGEDLEVQQPLAVRVVVVPGPGMMQLLRQVVQIRVAVVVHHDQTL
jgi:hypothetical protein